MRIAVLATILAMAAALGLAADIPNRLPMAETGEWLLLRVVSGEKAGELVRFSVCETRGDGDDRVVVMRMEKLDQDGSISESRDIESPVARHAERLAELEAKAKQISRERMTVKDREITVVAVTWDDDEGSREFKLWVSGELPIGGVVKSWSSDPDFPAAELVDYGFR